MKLLIVTPQYMPDAGPSAPLFEMLARELVQQGHQVTVIAAVPHYPSGQVPPEFRRGWLQRSSEQGVEVIRVRVPSVDRRRLSRRLLQFAAYQIGAAVAGLWLNYDALLITNPALEAFLPFLALSTLRRKVTVFSVHDLYPDVGIELGIFTNPLVIKLVGGMERFCLNHADTVRVLSQSFYESMRRMAVPDEKIVLIYDWVDTDFITPQPRQNAFAAEQSLDDKFVLLYAGNIGLSQNLESVLTAAQEFEAEPQLAFVFVGEGAGKASLQQEARNLGLRNVRFLPFQPRPRLPEVLAAADVSLVSLKSGVGTGSLPSKTYSYLASGRPILAIVDESSDSAAVIRASGGGEVVPPGDPHALAQAIRALYNDPRKRRDMGDCGRAYVVAHHSPQEAASAFLKLFARRQG